MRAGWILRRPARLLKAGLAGKGPFPPFPGCKHLVYDSHVMPGLEPGIQIPGFGVWMAGSILGSSPGTAMTGGIYGSFFWIRY
jgi:hypothetical protein